MSNFLERIIAAKLQENRKLFAAGKLAEFQERLAQRPPGLSLKRALDDSPPPAIIAEIKKASPSKGLLAPDLDPLALALAYQANGAAAISVLTERQFFLGAPELITLLRPQIKLPLLRKDFILEPVQVYETAALGADALLLIVAALQPGMLRVLLLLCREVGLEALVEVHTAAELALALDYGATLIGVNHRNLRTFEVDPERTLALLPLVPPGVTLVAASGLKTRADLARLEQAGIRAFLIGETLVKAADPGAALRELRGDLLEEGL